MWNEPYLETCCRSALHRLCLCGADGRPDGSRPDDRDVLKDERCLHRLRQLGLAELGQSRYRITPAGCARHDREIMKVA